MSTSPEVLFIPLTKSLKRRVRRAAKRQAVPMTEYVRSVLADAVEKHETIARLERAGSFDTPSL